MRCQVTDGPGMLVLAVGSSKPDGGLSRPAKLMRHCCGLSQKTGQSTQTISNICHKLNRHSLLLHHRCHCAAAAQLPWQTMAVEHCYREQRST